VCMMISREVRDSGPCGACAIVAAHSSLARDSSTLAAEVPGQTSDKKQREERHCICEGQDMSAISGRCD